MKGAEADAGSEEKELNQVQEKLEYCHHPEFKEVPLINCFSANSVNMNKQCILRACVSLHYGPKFM